LRSLPWSIRRLRPNSKTAWDALHIAHGALEVPDRSRATYTCALPAHKPVRRGREMIDQLFKHALV
jgi:hypothetical protein